MTNKKTSKVVLICCLVVMLATLIVGCAKDEEEEVSEVQLSFINEQYILDGGGEAFAQITIGLVLEKTNEYGSALAALREPPEGYESMLASNLVINSASASSDGVTVTVDFSSKGLSGSSMQEDLLISQIVRTLCLNFGSITYVQFTVDGKVVETLMGHSKADEPYFLQEYIGENGDTQYTVQSGVYCPS